MIRPAAAVVGQKFLTITQELGEAYYMLRSAWRWLWRSEIEWRQTAIQSVRIGVDSLPVTAMTSFFTGMVMALQTGTTSKDLFNEPLYVGTVVSFSMVKELGPVLTALVVSGRAGAAIAAEIGTMKVTEQIDALSTLGTGAIRYLVIPRFLACLLTVPMLTVFAMFAGTIGGLFVGVTKLDIPQNVFMDDVFTFMKIKHFMHGYIKSYFFAGLIATICCHKGLSTRGGAEGVGRATTAAVVVSMVTVLLGDYFLTAILVALDIG